MMREKIVNVGMCGKVCVWVGEGDKNGEGKLLCSEILALRFGGWRKISFYFFAYCTLNGTVCTTKGVLWDT